MPQSDLLAMIAQEMTESYTSITVKQSILKSYINEPNVLHWSHLRDLLYDDKQMSVSGSRDADKENTKMFVPLKFRKYDIKYMRACKIDILTGDTVKLPPNTRRFTLFLQTTQHAYTAIAPNEFVMWTWIRTIRLYHYLYQLKHRRMTRVDMLHASRQHASGMRNSEDDLTFGAPLMLTVGDQSVNCHGVLNGETMSLLCTETVCSRRTTTNLDLSDLVSITVSTDVEECSPYDLQVTILSGRLSSSPQVNAQSDANVNPLSMDGCTILEQQSQAKEEWKPLFFLKKGGQIGANIVMGTAEGVISVASGTASTVLSMASGVTEGVLNVVQSSASVATGGSWNTESKTRVVICAHGIRDQSTEAVKGHNPYWNKSFLVGMGANQLTPEYSKSHGIFLFLFSGPDGNEQLSGQKFVLYDHLIGENALHEVDPKSATARGGGNSRIREITVPIDNEIELRIEVAKGVRLLPPSAVSPIAGTLLSDPLSVLDKLSSIAGLSQTVSNSVDRDPRLVISFVRWMGSEKSNDGKYLKSKIVKQSLNPEWNEVFTLPASDGLHWANYVRIKVIDTSRTGIGALMGAVYIPIDDFKWYQGVGLYKQYPIVPMEGMVMENCYGDIGSLIVCTKLVLNKKTFGTNGPPVVTFQTQLRSVNEYNTMFIGDATSRENMFKTNAREVFETFVVAPRPDALHLMDYRTTAKEQVENKSKLLTNQFHRRKWSGEPDQSMEVLEVYLFENQRRALLPPYEWGRGHLLPTDRAEFTDETGTVISPYNPYDSRAAPLDAEGFEWDSDWKIDMKYTTCDENGWSYGVDFGWIMNSYRRNDSTSIQIGRSTRRRCWVRSASRAIGKEIGNETSKQRIMEIDIFENQRRAILPPNEWSAENLTSSDRYALSDETGKYPAPYSSLDDATPPIGCIWDHSANGGWKLDMTYTETDENGWSYGIDFDFIMSNYKKKKSTISPIGRFCRRRRWYRRVIVLNDSALSDLSIKPVQDELNSTKKEIQSKKKNEVPTKRDIYKTDTTSLLRLCAERDNVESPIVIPWDQVTRADIVTPGILSLQFKVNRYFGEKESPQGGKEEVYHEIDIELFVLGCPAEALCTLIQERIQLFDLRKSTFRLISSGSMSGDNLQYDADSAPLQNDSDSFLSAKDLSLGSSTILLLDNKIVEIENRIKEINLLTSTRHDWITTEKDALNKTLFRIKLYTAVLLGAGLIGPSYEEVNVRQMLRNDVEFSEKLFFQKNAENDLDSARNSVSFLLDTAEMRIRDVCLCGWSHRGGVLEECLRIIINLYYIHIVEFLGIYFDSDKALSSVQVHILTPLFI
jgi:hypothetical protein